MPPPHLSPLPAHPEPLQTASPGCPQMFAEWMTRGVGGPPGAQSIGQEVALVPEIRKQGDASSGFPGLKGSWVWPQGWTPFSLTVRPCGAALRVPRWHRAGSPDQDLNSFFIGAEGNPLPLPLPVQAALVCGEEVPPPSVLMASSRSHRDLRRDGRV